MDKIIKKICPKHGLTDFVYVESESKYRCKKCRTKSVIDKRRRNKIELVKYKGGKCEICGYDKCIDALEFHHLNPSEKEFTISGKSYALSHLIEEVNKCMLVCANCHHEIHSKERELKRGENEKEVEKNKTEFINSVSSAEAHTRLKNSMDIDKNEVESLINEGKNIIEIAEKLNLSPSSIRRFISINNIEYASANNKLANKTFDDFIVIFKLTKSLEGVGKDWGSTGKAVSKWLERNGYPCHKKELLVYLNNRGLLE